MKKITVVFMGSGAFGIPCLAHLLERPDLELHVVTQPDRPAGRGQATQATPAAEVVSDRAPVKKFGNVNDPAAIDELRGLGMDLLIVCDFGQILKPAVLALPTLGPFNVHGSLLPAYRGAAPIQRALLDGARVTGVTFLRVNERCDAGPIVSQAETEVGAEENFGSLHERLSRLTVPLLDTFLSQCLSGRTPPERPQDAASATMAPKIKKEELHLSFAQEAESVIRRIRAFSPSPGAYAIWNSRRVKVLEAKLVPAADLGPAEDEPSGVVCLFPDRHTLSVRCAGSTHLSLERLQPEGSRVMTAREILNGHPDIVGATFT